MKKILLLFLIFLSIKAQSQTEEAFYVFDGNWKPTKIETAHFLLHTHMISDSCTQWDYYNFMGPLIKTEQYRDKNGSELNGTCRYYNGDGYIDSLTGYYRGKKDGESWKRDEKSLKYKMKYLFKNDSLIEAIDLSTLKKDSVVVYKDEKESEFPGGNKSWASYLKENLQFPDRANNANIQGQVVADFMVDETGHIIKIYISHSVEYSLDDETIKIITKLRKVETCFYERAFCEIL